LYRFVSTEKRHFISTHTLVCVALLWQFATLPTSAQNRSPQSVATPQRAIPPQTVVNVDALLAQTGSAIDRGDYVAAVQSFRKASAAANQTPRQTAGLQRLRGRFAEIGIDGALLSLPPQNSSPSIQRLPAVVGAKPISARDNSNIGSLTSKQQALRLVALGRAALDRGEVSYALTLAKQAEALQVPTKEFNPGESQPWQLVLDAESAARTKGISLASATAIQATGRPSIGRPSTGAVQHALATGPAGDPAFVQQMLFTADAAAIRTGGNDVQQVQGIAPLLNGQDQQSYGAQLFDAGLDHLTRGDKAKALEQFKAAWKHETDLNPTQRNQLKDKLTLLQATPLRNRITKPEGELTPIQKADLEQQQKIRRLYREVTSELAKAEESKATQPLNSLDKLQRLSRRVDDSDIDDASKHSLAKMVDRAISDQKQYVEANRAEIDLDLRNEEIRSDREADQLRDSQIDQEVKSLVDSFNRLLKEKRFAEAEVIAKQVAELRPDHPIAVQLAHNSRTKSSIDTYQEIKDMKEGDFLRQMIDVDRSTVGINPENPLEFGNDRDWAAISAQRAGYKEDTNSHLSERERDIKKKLSMPVSIKYVNRPLSDVMEDLAAATGVPIVIEFHEKTIQSAATMLEYKAMLSEMLSKWEQLEIPV
jgi:general secretion pathway protein D